MTDLHPTRRTLMAAAAGDASLFVTEAEAQLFRQAAPEVAGRVGVMQNGVDSASLPDSEAAPLNVTTTELAAPLTVKVRVICGTVA